MKYFLIIILLATNSFAQNFECVISMPKTSFKFGEFIDIELYFQNTSTHDIKLIKPHIPDEIKLHLISSSTKQELPHVGGIGEYIQSFITLKPGEKYFFSSILNFSFGEDIPGIRTVNLIPSGEYEFYAELSFENENVSSNTIKFVIHKPTTQELYKFEELKRFLTNKTADKSSLRDSALKMENLFKDSDEGFRPLALDYLASVWGIRLQNQQKSFEIEKKRLLDYPSSYLSMNILATESFKNQTELKNLVSISIKNDFYKRYLNKVLED